MSDDKHACLRRHLDKHTGASKATRLRDETVVGSMRGRDPLVIDGPFIFFGNPRAANTSMKHVLEQHPRFIRLDLDTQWDRAFRFVIVRNPLSRLVSAYRHLHHGGSMSDFRSFVRDRMVDDQGRPTNRHWMPQNAFTHCECGTMIVHKVMRFEALDKDWDDLRGCIGVDMPDLPHMNWGWSKPEWCHWFDDDATRDRAMKFYRRDYDLLATMCGW